MGIIRFARSHANAVVAVLLGAAFLLERSTTGLPALGDALIDGLTPDEPLAVGVCLAFLLSLALRRTAPLVPLALAFAALALFGQGPIDGSTSFLAGLVLACYSVGAWAGGRVALVGALGIGGLAGLVVLRTTDAVLEPRDVAPPVFLLVGAWLAGLAVRSVRVERGDERVVGTLEWELDAGLPDVAARDELVRELRDIIERAMSSVVIQARTARMMVRDDPARVDRALATIDAAGTEALAETQRLAGLLLSPDGAALLEPRPGLAGLDELAAQVTAAGLPVDMRVEGRPLPLTPDLDGVAYRVVHEALMATLYHATSAQSRVVVRYGRDALELEVTDDGLALEGVDAEQETAGLLAVRREVAALGGTLDAGPGDERGYWVLARLPYEPDWS